MLEVVFLVTLTVIILGGFGALLLIKRPKKAKGDFENNSIVTLTAIEGYVLHPQILHFGIWLLVGFSALVILSIFIDLPELVFKIGGFVVAVVFGLFFLPRIPIWQSTYAEAKNKYACPVKVEEG